MGCGPSKEEQDAETSSVGWCGSPKSREPLLGPDGANGSSLGAKVEAANDVTVSQTKHVHRLGPLTLIENPLLSPDLDELLLLEEYQVSEEPETPDLTGVEAILRSMLLPCGDVSLEGGDGPKERGKRTTYSRQNTYTKTSPGVVNLGFEENKTAGHKQPGHSGVSTSVGPSLPSITESTSKTTAVTVTSPTPTTTTTITTSATTTTATATSKTQKQKTEEDCASRKTSSESEAPVIKGSEESVSSSESESESEDEGGSVVGRASLSLLSQLGGASTYQSDSSIFTAASEVSRKKAVPSREMKAALKVLNDSIGKPVRSGQQLTNALNIIQREWLKVSSQKDADPHAVEDYMDAFEEYSKNLLQRVVNLADVNGNTAMHYAVSHGNFDVVSVLLDSKVCNVNQQNKAGYTATMLVSLAQIRSQTHASVVQRLFQLGDLNIKASQHGQTALMLAVSHGRLDMVQMLVAAGAEVNIQDEDGSTALMCAAEHGHLAIVKFLLAQPDTDPTLMDNDGSTALTIAVEAGHRDVGVLLYKHLNLSRGSSPYSSVRIKRSRTPTALSRSSITPPPRSSAPSSPGRSRKSSNPASPGRSRKSSASLSNLIL